MRSISAAPARDDASPVEAIDELRGDRLNKHPTAIDRGNRTCGTTSQNPSTDYVGIVVVKVRETIHAFQEQTGQEVKRIFGAAAKKPAVAALARQREASRQAGRGVDEVGLSEIRLGPTAVHVG